MVLLYIIFFFIFVKYEEFRQVEQAKMNISSEKKTPPALPPIVKMVNPNRIQVNVSNDFVVSYIVYNQSAHDHKTG